MDFLHQIFGPDLQAAGLIILNLIVIESLLSVDNAAVLATMVIDLPKEQRSKALRYGIIGAYVFRGICLALAAWLVNIWWLQPLGGIYLLWLAVDQFKDSWRIGERGSLSFKIASLAGFIYFIRNESASLTIGSVDFNPIRFILFPILIAAIIYFAYSIYLVQGDEEDDGEVNKSNNAIYTYFFKYVGLFWATVALVEVMDLAFSIDNVFAVVAFTKNQYLIYIGVFIGILAMRFVAQAFVRLIERFPFLETVAFLVIGLLGIKLCLSLYTHFSPQTELAQGLKSEESDLFVSVFTIAIFILPVISSSLFNFPSKSQLNSTDEPVEERK